MTQTPTDLNALLSTMPAGHVLVGTVIESTPVRRIRMCRIKLILGNEQYVRVEVADSSKTEMSFTARGVNRASISLCLSVMEFPEESATWEASRT